MLVADLGIVDGAGYTLMSDQQKGLTYAISNVWPLTEQRFCVRHIYANIKGLFRGAEIRKSFWIIVKSSTTNMYERPIEEMKKISTLADDDLLK